MKKRIERKVYYKLQFSLGKVTVEDVDWVRDAMDALEISPSIMKCFQNTSVSVFEKNKGWHEAALDKNNPDFTVYYKEESVDALDRFLFKLRLRFPNFVAHTTHTLQEHF
jgi:hypothetical protein